MCVNVGVACVEGWARKENGAGPRIYKKIRTESKEQRTENMSRRNCAQLRGRNGLYFTFRQPRASYPSGKELLRWIFPQKSIGKENEAKEFSFFDSPPGRCRKDALRKNTYKYFRSLFRVKKSCILVGDKRKYIFEI